MCFLALYSIRADNGWAQATEITSIIARIIFSIRSIFLFHIHTCRKETETLRKKYQALEHWHYEEEESTFHELCMLQHITSMPSYKLKFEDDDNQEHSVAAQWVVEWPAN